MRQAAITIDVDSLACYRQIHGLPPDPSASDPIYTHALPRFFALLAERKLPATLFLIGQDAPRWASVFEPIRALGCEVASHSFAHDYRLSQKSASEIESDLAQAEVALSPLAPNQRISGFRAPGYNVSPALLKAVQARGYYDSSLLPAPLYFGARAGAIGLYALRGRPSRSLPGDPRAFLGPLSPYRTDPAHPWRPGGTLLELPMACAPYSRLPLIGTSLILWPRWLRQQLLQQSIRALDSFIFEMHGLDLLDPSDPGVPQALLAAQPDLRQPAERKMSVFRELFGQLTDAYEVTTLAAMASRWSVTSPVSPMASL